MVPGQGPGWRHELDATSAGTDLDHSVQTWASTGPSLECASE